MEQRRHRRRARVASPPPGSRLIASGDAVGEKLRAMFQAVEAAPVPFDIQRLVQNLEKKRRGRAPVTN